MVNLCCLFTSVTVHMWQSICVLYCAQGHVTVYLFLYSAQVHVTVYLCSLLCTGTYNSVCSLYIQSMYFLLFCTGTCDSVSVFFILHRDMWQCILCSLFCTGTYNSVCSLYIQSMYVLYTAQGHVTVYLCSLFCTGTCDSVLCLLYFAQGHVTVYFVFFILHRDIWGQSGVLLQHPWHVLCHAASQCGREVWEQLGCVVIGFLFSSVQSLSGLSD